MPQPSVSTVAWDGHPFDVALAEAAALGIGLIEPAYIRGYVDFDESAFSAPAAAHLRRSLSDHGLGAQALSAHIDLTAPDAGPLLARRVGFAAEIGARILITNAGPLAGLSAIRAALDGVQIRLEDAGVTLALENPGHGDGDAFGAAAEGLAFLGGMDDTRIGLNYDVGNVWTYSCGMRTPEEDFPAARPMAVHVHLKDIRVDGADWRFCALGEGAIDFGALAPLLGEIPVALELPLRLARPRRGDPIRAVDPVPLDRIRVALAASLEHWRLANG